MNNKMGVAGIEKEGGGGIAKMIKLRGRGVPASQVCARILKMKTHLTRLDLLQSPMGASLRCGLCLS